MLNRKYLVFVALVVVSCLLGTLFYNAATQAQPPYDPWADITGSEGEPDGTIDMRDISHVARLFGSSGTPINHAALQFEGNISIPAAAFVPSDSNDDTRVYVNQIYNWEPAKEARFVAGVQLPDGATVTKVTCYYYDESTKYLWCALKRLNQSNPEFMSLITSFGSGGYGSIYDVTIDYATVDNSRWAYAMEVGIPFADLSVAHLRFNYAVIEYEYQ